MFPPLPDPFPAVLAEAGFTTPTPIQAAALPPLLAGRDVLGCAPTGSGKTLAFGIPLLAAIDLRLRRPQALVLCPTRELAAQVAATLRTLGRRSPGLRIVVLTGGEPGGHQRRALEEGVHVVVGTPGRVVDHLQRGRLDLGDCRILVLDEADRMLEMGFADQMEEIRLAAPPRRTALFSATLPADVASLAERWLHDPLRVDAGAVLTRREVACVTPDVRPTLVALLRRYPRALVFCNFKASAATLAADLRAAGLAAAALHGDLEQFDRDAVLAQLRNGSVRVLVATDVAARGLDVDGLDLVVQVEPATSPEAWIHRVGRTGRAGAEGLAVALVPDERRLPAIPRVTPAELLAAPELPPEAPRVTLRIAGGRKDKLRPGDVLGALTGEAGFAGAHIGRIEVQDRVTYVAVDREIAGRALTWLRDGRVKGRRFRVDALSVG